MDPSRFAYGKNQNASFNYQSLESESESEAPRSINGDFSFGGATDRRFAYSRQPSFHQPPQSVAAAVPEPHTPISIPDSTKPFLSRTTSSIDIPPPNIYPYDKIENFSDESEGLDEKLSIFGFLLFILKSARSGNKQIRKLFVLISLNVAYSSAELCIGLFSGRVGLVSDAFHLTFGCGLLTFSLFAMTTSRKKPDRCYTYGYKRLEVLSAFTNALFLLFLSFSLAVEALHAFIQDESEHKHYLIVSAVTNLLVNLIGVWFFRNYARINLGLILASWLLALGVKNAEVLCLGLVSFTVFMLVIPLFKTTGGVLLQMAPPSMPSSALSKCLRQVKKGVDDRPILQYVHNLYHDLGVQDLTVQVDYS